MSTELEDRLREEIRRVTAGVRVPPGLAEKARRRLRRRIAVRAVVAAGTAAAIAGAIVATVTTGASPEVNTLTTAYVVRHVESALASAAAAHDIVYRRATDGHIEQWTYRGPNGLSSRDEDFWHGQLVDAIGQTITPAGTTTITVVYTTKTWWTAKIRSAVPFLSVVPPYNPRPQTSCRAQISLDFNQPLPVLAANVRQALACGQLTNEGTQHVDGVAAIKLVSVITETPLRRASRFRPLVAAPPPLPITVTMILWVNPDTYLPVRVAMSLREGKTAPIQGFSSDIRWLAPTRANLALLRVAIPPGFRYGLPWGPR